MLLTFASRSVSASDCVVASSFVSVATFKSRNPTRTTLQCTNANVEYWRNLRPRPSESMQTVSEWFGSTASGYGGTKLFQILEDTSGVSTTGELGVLQHLIAFSLAVVKGYAPGTITRSYLAAIWMNYKTNGNQYVLAGSGINWDSSQLIAWLRYQMYTNVI